MKSLKSSNRLFVPGRINLLGEHLDYNGGPVLPFTLDKGLTAVWRPRDDHRVQIYSQGQPTALELDLRDLASHFEVNPWYLPAVAMLRMMMESYPEASQGFSVDIASTLPPAAGLSSSAATEILMGWIFCRVQNIEPPRSELALAAQKAEHHFLNVRCGIMDMWAIAHGRKNFITQIDCSGPIHQYLPFHPEPWHIVILHSGISRRLESSEYNDRRASCERALARLRQMHPITHLAEAGPEMLALLEDPIEFRRTRHVITETQRVYQATEALTRGTIEALGPLLKESHASLQTDYEVTGAPVDAIAEAANNHPACLGCRLTGAGFGGCLVALVFKNDVKQFERDVLENLRLLNWDFQPQIIPVESGEIRED